MIHLGYETGTGKPVSISLAHMAVTGQTQQSGKTTTLEALIDRGELRAVVFVTKPGEKSFTDGRQILPFFTEHADWEYVKELLEARRAESLSKWDGYLMRVCSRAKSLKDVRANVEKELPKKKSARPSHYEVLAGYLDLIIPELDRVAYTDKLDLQPGVNIMNLAGMSDEMQSMVMRSTIERIHHHERNTVLVLPEAWKFIPEGGRSAVFQALHALIREGATNGNFVWIDAQDLAVVSKRILKSVTVWILGKQQEANEVARTINHLIEPLQIRPDMIKSLGIGQFLICADSHPARRVYVQPKWLGELDALAIARGEESVQTAQAIYRQKLKELKRQPAAPKFVTQPIIKADQVTLVVGDAKAARGIVTQEDGKNEKDENQSRKAAEHGGAVLPTAGQERAGHQMRLSTTVSVAHGVDQSGHEPDGSAAGIERAPENKTIPNENRPGSGIGEDETMWKEKYEALALDYKSLAALVAKMEQSLNRIVDEAAKQNPCAKDAALQFAHNVVRRDADYADFPPLKSIGQSPIGSGIPQAGFTVEAMETVYGYIKGRAHEDPNVLHLLAQRPELRVTVEIPVLTANGDSVRGGIALLIHQGFFKTPKNGNVAFNELKRLGRKVAKPKVYRELANLAQLGFLTDESDGYQSTDLKVTVHK